MTKPNQVPLEIKEAIIKLDGVAAVNIDYPTRDDFKRLLNANSKLADKLAAFQSREAVLLEALKMILNKTITDPAEGPELRARAAQVFKYACEAIAKHAEMKGE